MAALSTDGSSVILQVRVTLLPIGTTGLGMAAMMDTAGAGTGEELDLQYQCLMAYFEL